MYKGHAVYVVSINDEIDDTEIFSSMKKAKLFLHKRFNETMKFYEFSETEKQHAISRFNIDHKMCSFCIEDLDGYQHIGMVRKFFVH